MALRATAILVGCPIAAPFGAHAASRAPIYFPERNDWQQKKPADAGMNSPKLDVVGKMIASIGQPEK